MKAKDQTPTPVLSPVDLYQEGVISSNLVEGAIQAMRGGAMLADNARNLKLLFAAIGGKDHVKREIQLMLKGLSEWRTHLTLELDHGDREYVADQIGWSVDLDRLTLEAVHKVCKQRKDAALKAISREFRLIGREVRVGKQRVDDEKTVTFPRIVKEEAPAPQVHHGKEKGRIVQPTTGEQPKEQVNLLETSPAQQVKAMVAAFDALPADLQDEVAQHVLATLKARKDSHGHARPGNRAVTSLGQALAAAIAESRAAATH